MSARVNEDGNFILRLWIGNCVLEIGREGEGGGRARREFKFELEFQVMLISYKKMLNANREFLEFFKLNP